MIIGLILSASIILICIYTLYIYARHNSKLKKTLAITQNSLQESLQKEQELQEKIIKIQDKFHQDSLHDPLTGLPGRQVFEDRLEQTLHQSERYQLTFAIIFLDIDEFKIINEALGYEIGDELLKEVGQRLQTSIRQIDTLSRFAGDVFAFILPQLAKAETAAFVAQRVLEALTEPFELQDKKLFITASCGISIFPTDASDAKTLLKNCDMALHQAKVQGRNTFQFYSQEMYSLSQRELILNSSMRSDTIFKDFEIYYYPILNISTKKIEILEAKLHWQHPDLGPIENPELIRFAENNGRITAIGEWMLKQILQQLQTWETQKIPIVQVAFDVSLKQIENMQFIYRMSQLIKSTNISPDLVILQISEKLLLAKPEKIEKALHMMKHLGVKISMNNFGTGLVSLPRLKRYPLDFLIMDPSLIQNLAVEKDNENLIKMIIALAKSLSMLVVAEGIESEKQKNILRDLGCFLMQGRYFSSPFLGNEFNMQTSGKFLEKM